MLLMRYDDRATFGRALEDLDRRHRHAAGAVVEAFRNLSIRLNLAVFDGDTKLRMPRLPPIECNLIDAERVGHFLLGSSEERKSSGEVSEFRTIQGGCTPADAFGDLLRGDASARL